MAGKRILSIWFPRLAAERVQRRRGDALPAPLAVVGDRNGAQVLVSLSPEAEAQGLALGQPLRDATAICPGCADELLPCHAIGLGAGQARLCMPNERSDPFCR